MGMLAVVICFCKRRLVKAAHSLWKETTSQAVGLAWRQSTYSQIISSSPSRILFKGEVSAQACLYIVPVVGACDFCRLLWNVDPRECQNVGNHRLLLRSSCKGLGYFLQFSTSCCNLRIREQIWGLKATTLVAWACGMTSAASARSGTKIVGFVARSVASRASCPCSAQGLKAGETRPTHR